MNQNSFAFSLFLGMVVTVLLSCAEDGVQVTRAESYPDSPGAVGLEAFLDSFVRIHPSMTSIHIEFTGEYLDLPRSLAADLERYFPEYRFTLAKMEYFDNRPVPANLILVTDPGYDAVTRYLWAMTVSDPPRSFRRFLSGQVGSDSEVLGAVRAIAEMLAFSAAGQVGEVSLAPADRPGADVVVTGQLFGEGYFERILVVTWSRKLGFVDWQLRAPQLSREE